VNQRFSSLAEEVADKSKKLRKLHKKYQVSLKCLHLWKHAWLYQLRKPVIAYVPASQSVVLFVTLTITSYISFWATSKCHPC
jgi:hypothetical protein